jgi:hypothetical protein
MTAQHGASPDTWAHFSFELDLTEDLLPVVCNPRAEVAPSSVLKSFGKVPSRYTSSRQVVGIPKWTQHLTTDEDIRVWSQEPDYGICLQTRRIRALDVDIEDFDLSCEVQEVVESWGREHGIVFPIRSRHNSAKWLTLFELKGEYAKQILQTKAGVIEFLGNGQQALVAGSHPSGARYEWGESNAPRSIPTLSATQLSDLHRTLRESVGTKDWTEGRVRKARTGTNAATDLNDPVAQYLRSHGWVRS